MRSTAELEALILRNLDARRPAFEGFSDAERADYAETVRIGNEARAEADSLRDEQKDTLGGPGTRSDVPYVDVWYEDGIKLARPIRVF